MEQNPVFLTLYEIQKFSHTAITFQFSEDWMGDQSVKYFCVR